MRIYLDVDQNGLFDTNAGEQIAAAANPDAAFGTVDLAAGESYLYAAAHHEYGGGSRIEPTIQVPGGTRELVHPGVQGVFTVPVDSKTTVDGGALQVNAALTTGNVLVDHGGRIDVNEGGSLSADTLTITRGTVDTHGNLVRLTGGLERPGLLLTATAGSFGVSGSDLATGIDVLSLGGTVRLSGPRAPIAHWGFDETTGDTAANSADPTHDGTLIDMPADDSQWVDVGKVGNALLFNGTGYVDVPDGYADFTGGITVAAWVYTNEFSDWGRVIDFGNGQGTDNILLSRRGTSSNLRWDFQDTASGNEQMNLDGVFTRWSWQHFVATGSDGPTNGAVQKIYRDGELRATREGASVPANVVRVNNYIGKSNWDAHAPFNGMMDELMIWDRELTEAEVTALYTAGIVGEAAPDFTLPELSGVVNGNGAIDGDAVFSGTLAPSGPDGTGAGTISLAGESILTPAATYVVQLDGAQNSRLVNSGNSELALAGTLEIVPGAVDPADEGSAVTRTIVDTVAEGVITGNFDAVPPSPVAGDPITVGHLGSGVFNLGLSYFEAIPPVDPPNYLAVDVELYIAGGGDANADGRVDGQDITNLITNFSRPGDPADRTWLRSDTAGGLNGRGDGNVDGQDITDLISNFTGDAGPAAEGTAAAVYNPATGEFRVTVDGVLNWSLISDGQFAPSALDALGDVLPAGGAANLVSGNVNTVGEGSFDGAIGYAELDLGPLADAGTDASEFQLEYITTFGGQPQFGTIHVVPEPSTTALLLVGLAGLWYVRRRR